MNLPETSLASNNSPNLARSSVTIGVEWLIDAAQCDPQILRDRDALGEVFERIITELNLQIIGGTHWHQFPMPGGGITGFALLTESHLACHTYPEHGVATFNLYCCRARPSWAWRERLREMLGAAWVSVRSIERCVAEADHSSMPGDESSFLQREFIVSGGSRVNGGRDEQR